MTRAKMPVTYNGAGYRLNLSQVSIGRPDTKKNAMSNIPNPELIDDENPEWTEEDFARARPAREVLPPALYAALTDKNTVIRFRHVTDAEHAAMLAEDACKCA